MIQKCKNLHLYRIKDAHCFFNAFDWYVSTINSINSGRSNYWDDAKQDAKLCKIFGRCSGNSLVKDHGLSLAFAMVNKDDAGIPKIRKEILELWVTWKLNDARDQPTLPENFFPKTLDISTYVQTQKKIEGGDAICPAADDAHAAKCLQSNQDKKKACNQAQNLQIFCANVGGDTAIGTINAGKTVEKTWQTLAAGIRLKRRNLSPSVMAVPAITSQLVEEIRTRMGRGRGSALRNRVPCGGILAHGDRSLGENDILVK